MYEFSKPSEEVSQKFFDSIKILFVQSKIFGLVTFDATFRPSTVHLIVNILAIAVYLPASFYSIYDTAVDQDDGFVPLIYRATDVIILVVNAAYVSTAWIQAITNRDRFVDFVSKLMQFDTKLETMGVCINYRKCQKKILMQCSVRYLVLAANIGTLMSIAIYREANLVVESMAYCLIVINSAICHQSYELVMILRARFVILNRQIGDLVDFFRKNEARKLHNTEQLLALSRICALHHHLSKLVKQFNEIFGVVLLMMFGVSFVIIVISIFYLTASLQNTILSPIDIVTPFLSNVTFIINIVYVCDACYATTEEVNKTGALIHKIDTEDHDMRDEIEMFSLQIANEQVEFNAAGFFAINYTLIFSIVGGVTTYIIILIQLSASLAA